ncbi:MAG: hypothetical protein U9R23_07720 [Candidatus Cloacimonadota bacterium]|nr:hypothetical protein [Candidatus Cloacimonadota bacterium]
MKIKNKKYILFLFSVIIVVLYIMSCGKLTSPSKEAPTNLKIEKIVDGRIKLTWNYFNTNDTIQFVVARRAGEGNWNENYEVISDESCLFEDNIPTNDSLVYAYKVKAENITKATSSYFSEVIAYFSDNTTPTNIVIEQITQDTIKIIWNDRCAGEDGYLVDKKIGNGLWNNNYKKLTANVNNFLDTTTLFDTIYYRVSAFVGESKSVSVENSITPTFPSPSNLTYSILAITKIKLNWTDNSDGEEGFKIDKKLNDGNWQSSYGTTAENATQWTDNNADINQNIKYRVYAYGQNHYSSFIETDEIDDIFPAPSNVTLQKPDPSKIKIMWDDNSQGEQGFYIDKKIGELDWVTEYATIDSNITNWIDDIPQPCGTFYYRVRAFYNGFYSDYSNEEHTNIRLKLVDSLNTLCKANEVFVSNSGWYAFVADGYNGLVIIDCINPTLPNEITTMDLPDRTLSVFVQDNLAYVTNHNGGFNFVDISIINSPEIIGSCFTEGMPNDVFVYGDYAYVADGAEGLTIIITSGDPHFSANISTNGDARRVFVKNSCDYAFVANGLNGGLAIIDISDPSTPISVSNLPINGLSQDVYVLENYAYLANGEYGLEIIDISDVNSPTPVANCPTNGFAYSVYAQDNYVYLADKDRGLIVIDVSNPLSPYVLGNFEMSTEPVSIYKFGSYVYLADNEGLKIIQVAP